VTRVSVDTSALLALLDRADPRHAAVRDAFAGLRDAELLTKGQPQASGAVSTATGTPTPAYVSDSGTDTPLAVAVPSIEIVCVTPARSIVLVIS
jgi:hypothetical protein